MENTVVCEKLDNASYAIRLYHLAMIFYIEMKRNVYVICKKSVANQTKSCVCVCVGMCMLFLVDRAQVVFGKSKPYSFTNTL